MGDSDVGKSSIAQRYVAGVFSESNAVTVCANFVTKRMYVNFTADAISL